MLKKDDKDVKIIVFETKVFSGTTRSKGPSQK